MYPLLIDSCKNSEMLRVNRKQLIYCFVRNMLMWLYIVSDRIDTKIREEKRFCKMPVETLWRQNLDNEKKKKKKNSKIALLKILSSHYFVLLLDISYLSCSSLQGTKYSSPNISPLIAKLIHWRGKFGIINFGSLIYSYVQWEKIFK